MQIGKLDQWISLQSPTETNTSGSVVKAYTTVATVPAHIISERGQEALASARVNAKERLRVLIRHRTDIDVKWRIVWDSKNYNILNADRSGRRSGELWLTCELVGAV